MITVKQKPEATIRWKEKSETNLGPIMEESQSENAGEGESSLLASRSMRTVVMTSTELSLVRTSAGTQKS